MPKGKGTYGSKRGRPTKRVKKISPARRASIKKGPPKKSTPKKRVYVGLKNTIWDSKNKKLKGAYKTTVKKGKEKTKSISIKRAKKLVSKGKARGPVALIGRKKK